MIWISQPIPKDCCFYGSNFEFLYFADAMELALPFLCSYQLLEDEAFVVVGKYVYFECHLW